MHNVKKVRTTLQISDELNTLDKSVDCHIILKLYNNKTV